MAAPQTVDADILTGVSQGDSTATGETDPPSIPQSSPPKDSGVTPQKDQVEQRCVAVFSSNLSSESPEAKAGNEYFKFIKSCGFSSNPDSSQLQLNQLIKRDLSGTRFSVVVVNDKEIGNSLSLQNTLEDIKKSKTQRCLLVYCKVDSNRSFDTSVDFSESFYQESYKNIFCLYKVAAADRIENFFKSLKEHQTLHWQTNCIGSIIRKESFKTSIKEKGIVDLKYGTPEFVRFRQPCRFNEKSRDYLKEDSKLLRTQDLQQMKQDATKNEDKMGYYERHGEPTALVVNCVTTGGADALEGSKVDSDRLCYLFENMLFGVVQFNNLKASELIRTAEEFKEHHNLWILVITAFEKDGKIECSDGLTVTEAEIISALKNTGNRSAPKLVIFNLRIKGVEQESTDGTKEKADARRTNIPYNCRELAQYLRISMNTDESHHSQAGLVTCRYTEPLCDKTGSELVKSICTAYYKHADSKDVVSLINEVNKLFRRPSMDGFDEKPRWTWLTHRNFFLCKTDAEQPSHEKSNGKGNSSQEKKEMPAGPSGFQPGSHQALILLDSGIQQNDGEILKKAQDFEKLLAASGYQSWAGTPVHATSLSSFYSAGLTSVLCSRNRL
ncbi:hypothetical protein BOX15_Mlig027753g1 [Macrostomum lignano]|uniref:Caspase family p20 domain-containing protein n=1 Tax=Macrostomum lignano TaxID=282301 RepID=A0A267F7V9_9PLAT|nr:hypothetical protein BOX15_Mlig027753g1 [Macrostomum lignano]